MGQSEDEEEYSPIPYSLFPSPSRPMLCSFNNLRMKGSYQRENASVATTVAQLLGVDAADIRVGLENATWPGRFEVFEGVELPCKVIVDGAHNVDGARALREALLHLNIDPSTSLRSSQDDVGRRIAVFAALKDKDVAGILEEVGSLFDRFFVYEVDSPRAMSADELASITAKFAKTKVGTSAEDALMKAVEFAKKEGHQNLVVCFGSLYSIGDIRRYLLKRR